MVRVVILALAFVAALACTVPLPAPPDVAEAAAPECVESCEGFHSRCTALARMAGSSAPKDRNHCRKDLRTCYAACASVPAVSSEPPAVTAPTR